VFLPAAGRTTGRWLVVEDPQTPATVIVVLGGGLPLRALAGAAAFREGLAPEVWLTQGRGDTDPAVLASLDIPDETELSRRVLVRRGVPADAIHILPERNDNTADEVRTVAGHLRERGGGTVIFVTSKAHTRRVKVLWGLLAPDLGVALTRYSANDPFDPERWWGNSRDALAVAREYGGVLNAWAGFPIGARRPAAAAVGDQPQN
jgi:uncharacterized SAM-binding protein YcdF (DUF218 family)